jgi:maltose alpha-D-glucosyltransferase/alpha-amylase
MQDYAHEIAGPEASVEDVAPFEDFPYPLDVAAILGRRIGELHEALATPTEDLDFGSAPWTAADTEALVADIGAQMSEALRRLASAPASSENDELLARADEAKALIERLSRCDHGGSRTRIHGDLHLGQVLISHGDIFVIDFEGEPRRSIDERRAKSSPLRDVAGMLRSFDYAAFAAIDRIRMLGTVASESEAVAWAWRDRSAERFRAAYGEVGGDARSGAFDEELLQLFLLQKAFYEIAYEAANRPNWLSIPVRGVLSLLDEAQGH